MQCLCKLKAHRCQHPQANGTGQIDYCTVKLQARKGILPERASDPTYCGGASAKAASAGSMLQWMVDAAVTAVSAVTFGCVCQEDKCLHHRNIAHLAIGLARGAQPLARSEKMCAIHSAGVMSFDRLLGWSFLI